MKKVFPKISFIGAGTMASSLIGGLIADQYPADKIWASNPTGENLEKLKNHFAIQVTEDNLEAASHAEIIVFSVKPAVVKIIAQQLSAMIQKNKPLVISIAAGVRIVSLESYLGHMIPIVRCMPNTPALINCGATALYANENVDARQRDDAESILRAVGVVVWVQEETLLDLITALSGSGPAYFFMVMEALEGAAVDMGLEKDIAHLLTLQTALGAARMAIETKQPIMELRKRVTSPGGTTESGIKVLEQHNIKELFSKVMQAAKSRSEELAELF